MVAVKSKKTSAKSPGEQMKITSFFAVGKENMGVVANGSPTPVKRETRSPRKSPQKALTEENASKKCSAEKTPTKKAKGKKANQDITPTKLADGSVIYDCDLCGKQFEKRQSFRVHMDSHSDIKKFECEICFNKFRQRSHLVVHRRTHTNERPYKCDVCNKAFNVSNALTVHKRIHTGERPFKCDLCNKGFTESSKLTIHKRSHTGEKPYECIICHDRFAQANNMKKHIANFHTLEGLEPKYECNLCQKKFKAEGYLKIHMKYHTGDKEFACEQCPKTFITKSELVQHVNYHNGIKQFKCDICQKEFFQAPHLKHHMKMHASGKKQCLSCKRFYHHDTKFQHRCLPLSRSVSAKTKAKLAAKKAKMGHGLKVARFNKVPQIDDEVTQTGFEEALPAPVLEEDQVTISIVPKDMPKKRGRKRTVKRENKMLSRAGRPGKQAKPGTAMTQLLMIDEIKEEPEEDTADEAIDSLMESSRVKVQRIYSVANPDEDEDDEGRDTPEMRNHDDHYILGDEEGLITFNPREDTGIIANPIENADIIDDLEDTGAMLRNGGANVVIMHDFADL